jgi:hypothetical protein
LEKSNFNGRVEQTISASGVLTFSVYAKAGTDNFLFLRVDGGAGLHTAYFDLVNGTVGITALSTGAITAAGNGYYRCSISFNDTITIARIYVADANGDTSGTSGNILIQDAMLEQGDVATDYIATTSAAVSVGPVSGLPRLDYLNSSCPRLLLEPQRTNSVTYSEQFDNAIWQKTAAGTGVVPAVTANYATSPSGYQDADLVVFNRGAGNTGSDFSWLYQNFVTSAATYTISCYVKAATSADVGKNLSWRNFGGGSVWDVTLTNEWQRISVQATGGGSNQEVGFYNRGTYNAANSVSVLMWGFQAELGAYATSYIPTLGTSVTRVAESASKTGISSLIGQTEGTLFVEMKDLVWRGSAERIIGISDGTTQNRVILVTGQTSNTLRGIVTTGNVLQNSTTAAATFGNVKLAIAYSSAGGVVYANGSQVFSFGAISVPTCSALYIQTQEDGTTFPADGKTAQALVFKTRLTNAQLAELTT